MSSHSCRKMCVMQRMRYFYCTSNIVKITIINNNIIKKIESPVYEIKNYLLTNHFLKDIIRNCVQMYNYAHMRV